MGEESDESTGENAGNDEIDAYLDAADRLERGIDHQVGIINGIDDKAAHVIRILALLIGLVFSILSFIAEQDTVSIGQPSEPVELGFGIGILFLLLSMGAAIITYLSSKFRIGLHPTVGKYLGEPDTKVEPELHLKRVLGSYGEILEVNKGVIETNSSRFRMTLYFLLIGLIFLSVAGSLHIGNVPNAIGWPAVIVSGAISGVAGWYILGGNYLALPALEENNE